MTDRQSKGEREVRIRTAVVTYFPMFIATLSLLTSVYNGYLNSKFVDIIQRNVSRTEYMRTCKEIIDAYFQVKFRAGVIANGGATASAAQTDGGNAVAKFAALGTYLANLRDDMIRQRYSELSGQLSKVVGEASRTPAGQLDKAFAPADRIFADLNDDCVRSAKAAPL